MRIACCGWQQRAFKPLTVSSDLEGEVLCCMPKFVFVMGINGACSASGVAVLG
jgi:hypothetical protein